MYQPPIKRKHPAALPYLFLSEMWERYGFYIVKSLLILYLVEAFDFTDNHGYDILGAFMSFAYISPIIGGYLADKILGFRLAIIAGGIFLAVGYAGLAFLGPDYFIIALSCIIVGNGFFKPNISSLLGTLYDSRGAQRDAGFTIFYIGINVGALLATLSAGFITEYYGWSASFICASIGLIIGTLTFLLSFKKLGQRGLPPKSIYLAPLHYKILHHKYLIFAAAIISIPIFYYLIEYEEAANTLLIITGILVFFGLLYLALKEKNVTQKHHLFALIALFFISIIFWAFYFQIFLSVNLFVERDINRQIFNFEIPTAVFIGLEAIFILLIGPILAKLWQYLERKKLNPSTPFKFALGTIFLGIAFAVLALAIYLPHNGQLICPAWLLACYFFITLGELLLSPIGLSAVTILSPPRLVGMMMGIWFITLGFGGKLAGIFAEFSSIPENIHEKAIEMQLYGRAFLIYAIICIAAGLIFLTLKPLIKRWMYQNPHP